MMNGAASHNFRAAPRPEMPRMNHLTLARTEEILERATALKVLVVGDLMLDVYLRGSVSRISPEAPVPVVKVEEKWRALGGAANVAANVVALGAACRVVGFVGADTHALELRDALEAAGIDASQVLPVEGRPTTVKTRIMARQQQVVRYDQEDEEDPDGAVAEQLVARVRALVTDADVLVLEDYNKGVLQPTVIRAALDAAASAAIPVVVDPKSRFFFDYAGATVFKPNLLELAAALREGIRPEDPVWMEATRQRLGCRYLLLTLGEHGMALCTQEGEYLQVPALARSVYDVSGAGDTVTAVMAVALAAGATAAEAAVLANHAAGIEVGRAGVTTVAPAELRLAVDEHHAQETGN